MLAEDHTYSLYVWQGSTLMFETWAVSLKGEEVQPVEYY